MPHSTALLTSYQNISAVTRIENTRTAVLPRFHGAGPDH